MIDLRQTSTETTSTTCNVYWTNLQDYVTEVDAIPATCDSTLTSCTIYGSNGASEPVDCNSQLQVSSEGTNPKYAGYFCACGDNPITVPDIVQCTDKCYTLQTSYSCDVVTLDTGFTVGSPLNGVLADQCVTFRCDTAGDKCTDDGTLLWECDDTQHDSQDADSSTKSYVCNCNGPAQIPSLYQSNGQTQGQTCGGSGDSATVSSSAASESPTTSTAGSGSGGTGSGGSASSGSGSSGSGSSDSSSDSGGTDSGSSSSGSSGSGSSGSGSSGSGSSGSGSSDSGSSGSGGSGSGSSGSGAAGRPSTGSVVALLTLLLAAALV